MRMNFHIRIYYAIRARLSSVRGIAVRASVQSRKNNAKKKPAAAGSLCLLHGQDAQNVLADNHENEVEYPHDGETENQTNDARDNLAVGESGDKSAYPSGNGDNRQDNAYDVRKSKVIALAGHDTSPFFILVA